MPYQSLRPCAVPSCRALVPRGRCALHALQLERARPNADIRHWYYTARWNALKTQVRSEEPCCQACARAGLSTPTEDIDHIQPHRSDAALFFERTNLQGLCKRCHAQKTRRGL